MAKKKKEKILEWTHKLNHMVGVWKEYRVTNVLENIHTVINSNNWAKDLVNRKCNNLPEIIEQ